MRGLALPWAWAWHAWTSACICSCAAASVSFGPRFRHIELFIMIGCALETPANASSPQGLQDGSGPAHPGYHLHHLLLPGGWWLAATRLLVSAPPCALSASCFGLLLRTTVTTAAQPHWLVLCAPCLLSLSHTCDLGVILPTGHPEDRGAWPAVQRPTVVHEEVRRMPDLIWLLHGLTSMCM